VATTPPLTPTAVNALDEEAFVATFGGVLERSPWAARAAWRRRPFRGVSDLHRAFEEAMRDAGPEQQLALIRAHPELAGREAAAGDLSEESTREQVGAGLDRLSREDLDRLTALNAGYRDRFGFPLIVCVREHTPSSILRWGEERLGHPREREIETALGEIAKIARLRLHELVAPRSA
jgi:2-oxo-4-hydroxy-4-carboxy-5-ureidoimidazoline decarboxylase